MSSVKLPVTRSAGRALLVGGESCRPQPLGLLHRLGFQCAELDDPYLAMAEIVRRPRQYEAVVFSLLSLYREELPCIASIKRRCPHLEIWLTDTDGRGAALAEAMRLGADGLLTADGLHRLAATPAPEASTSVSPVSAPRKGSTSSAAIPVYPEDTLSPALIASDRYNQDVANGEPVLSAEELLRAWRAAGKHARAAPNLPATPSDRT